MKTGFAIAIAASALATVLVVAVARKRPQVAQDTDPGEDEDDMPSTGEKFENQDKAIAVGEKGDPSVAPLLAEIRAMWVNRGIDLGIIDPVQFYTMSKATHADGPDPDDEPGPILAIASRATWANTTEFVATVLEPVLEEFSRRGGVLSELRFGGFREGYGSDGKGTGSYNDATGGAPKSRHVDGDAADIIPKKNVSANTDRLLMAIASIKVRNPKKPIGFGAYAGNGHVDLGGSRHWSGDSVPGKAEKYLDRARKESAIS